MKADTHRTNGEVQYVNHWDGEISMVMVRRDDSGYLDELGHKFPATLLSFYGVYVWSVDALVEFRA